MSILVFDDESMEKIKSILAYAETHPFRPGDDPPGNNPQHVVHLGSYRSVFSYTHHPEGGVYRHLSVSVKTKGKFAHPYAVYCIAEAFGFTGWDGKDISSIPEGWSGSVEQEDNCVVLVQPVGAGDARTQ